MYWLFPQFYRIWNKTHLWCIGYFSDMIWYCGYVFKIISCRKYTVNLTDEKICYWYLQLMGGKHIDEIGNKLKITEVGWWIFVILFSYTFVYLFEFFIIKLKKILQKPKLKLPLSLRLEKVGWKISQQCMTRTSPPQKPRFCSWANMLADFLFP